MTVTKTYCDHCGKELSPKNDYCNLELEFTVRPYLDVDLCDGCMDELYRSIIRFCRKDKGI